MYNKIVDTVVASSREKPLAGGKCENWWSELDGDSHGLKKKGANIRNSGRIRQNSYMPQTINNALLFYKFKGFEFGNYMSQADRYDIFTAFLYCMQDLRKWLGTTNFGIKHQIGVAFGARGEGRFSAHYEPMTNIINMTKKRGAGALLHEYAHALDYTIGAFIDQCKGYTSLSGGREKEQKSDNVGCQFRAMMNKILNYVRSTESFTKLKEITHDSDYWCNSTELFARLTESYYAYYHNDSHNYYLVKPTSFYERSYGIYLSKAEMDVIKPELDKFWKEVGLLLNDKCKLKATPYPKETTVKKKAEQNAKSKEKGTKTTLMVYEIVKEQEKLLKKKRIKSNFKNKYKLAFRISQGKGSEYSVISAYDLDAFRFNAHERREFSIMLKEALKKAGIKATSTENGGTDGRPFYYKIDVDNLYRSPNYPDVRMSIIFRE